MKIVVTLTGIRPDFIRMSHVFRRLDESENIRHFLVHSGQHYDKMLSDVFFDELEIRPPDISLNVGQAIPDISRPRLVSEVADRTHLTLRKLGYKPDVIMFLGDSHSALAAPMLRKYGYRIAHIEAGMRSYDMEMPEEVNRICCDHMCDFLFTYHDNYKDKLRKEGIDPSKIHVVGNTIVEAVNPFLPGLRAKPKRRNIILMDIHRPENIESPERLRNVLNFANRCSDRFGTAVYMVAFGRTKAAIDRAGLEMRNVHWIPLLSFTKYLAVQYDAMFMISDSGTAQEEPALLDTPVIVPRVSTERPESINLGCSRMLNVVTPDNDSWEDCMTWLVDKVAKKEPIRSSWLGDGTTSEKIVSILEEQL